MSNDVEKAIKLLKSEGYSVIKLENPDDNIIIHEKVKSTLSESLNLLINYRVLKLEDEILTGDMGFSSSYSNFKRMEPHSKYKIFSLKTDWIKAI